MKKIVFDADGLIKLTKAGLLQDVATTFECYISEEVFRETVIEGKKGMHSDAYQIEHLLDQSLLHKKRASPKEVNEPTLGRGELSAWGLMEQLKAEAIVSDDRKFLSLLMELDIDFVTPTTLIARLVQSNQLTVKKGLEGLQKIRGIVREESFEQAISVVREE